MTRAPDVGQPTLSPLSHSAPRLMLQVSTLGNAFIAAGDLRVPPSSSRTFATLLYLASEPGRRVPRAGLQALIFPDLSDGNASHSLRQLVYKLRQSGAPIESRGGEVWVGPDQVRVDYSEVIASDRLTAEQLASIEGGFLPGYNPDQNGEFSVWFDGYRTRTTLQIRRTVLRDLARARMVADWKTVERAARACLALDSLNEEATLALAEAIALSGSKAAAVRLLDDYLKEIGTASPDLRVPATVLRRRISERIPDRAYRSQPDLPFVGRDEEMAFLAEKFQRARRGESQCVVISGEPGIGKTRLAAEFANVAALDGARVERVSAQPHDVHRPLGAFIELVPRLLELPGALGCSPESMAALKRLTFRDSNAQTTNSPSQRDPESVFYEITRAISELIEAIATEVVLVLVVEDTHWLDLLSVRVIGDLVSVRTQRRFLVVLTSRAPSRLAESTRYADCISGLVLNGIGAEVAAGLIRDVTGVRDEALMAWMVSVSSGNPLFIASVTAHYLSTGERFGVPPTLNSLLAKRLEAIDRRTLAVLQMCAVFGKYCTLPRLRAALEMPQIDLLQAVQEAQERLLITIDGPSVTIPHALLTEAILDQSAELALRLGHRSAAEVLEAEGSVIPAPTRLWELAEHWAAAGDNEKALESFKSCAHHAMDIGRPSEAAMALSRALDLPLAPATRANVSRELVLLAAGCSEYRLARRGTLAWRSVDKSVKHDSTELAELRTNAVLQVDLEETVERLTHCLANPDSSRAHRLEAAMLILVIAQHFCRADLCERASVLLDNIIDSPRDAVGTELALIYHCTFGDLDQVANSAHRLREIAASQPPGFAVRTLLNVSRGFWTAGIAVDATECSEEAHAIAAKYRLTRLAMQAAIRLAIYYLDLDEGSVLRAQRWIERAEEISDEAADPRLMSEYATIRIQVAFATNRFADGLKYCRELCGQQAKSPSERRWNEGLWLRARQLTGDSALMDVDLGTLIKAATTLPRQDVCDLEIVIAADAMLGRGRRAQAIGIVNDYLGKTRLIRAPLDFALSRIARNLSGEHAAQRIATLGQ